MIYGVGVTLEGTSIVPPQLCRPVHIAYNLSMQPPITPIAILFQSRPPPMVDGVQKPMKPGGYRDSSADIAYILQKRGLPVVLPVKEANPAQDLDWIFPDDSADECSA